MATMIIRVKTPKTRAQYLTFAGTTHRKAQAMTFDSLTGIHQYIEHLQSINPSASFEAVFLYTTKKNSEKP